MTVWTLAMIFCERILVQRKSFGGNQSSKDLSRIATGS